MNQSTIIQVLIITLVLGLGMLACSQNESQTNQAKENQPSQASIKLNLDNQDQLQANSNPRPQPNTRTQPQPQNQAVRNTPSSGGNDELNPIDNLNDALEAANEQDKKLLITFVSPRCGWCTRLRQTTLKDPDVIQFIKTNFVYAIIDTSEYPIDSVRYGGGGVPNTVVADKNGAQLDRVQGYRDPKGFMQGITEILEGKSQMYQLRAMYEERKNDYDFVKSYLLGELIPRGMIDEAHEVYKDMKESYAYNPDFEDLTLTYYMSIIQSGGAERSLPILQKICDKHKDHDRIFDVCYSYALALFFADKKEEAYTKLDAMKNEYPSSQYPQQNMQIQSALTALKSMGAEK